MVRHLQRARVALRERRARRGDDGIALVAAIGVAIVALLLATTVVAVTVRSTDASGVRRDRDQAYAAAEAGLDAAAVVLAGGSGQWPTLCPTAPATTTPAVALTSTSTYQTVVTFGAALNASGGVTGSCDAAGAAYAQVVSTGTGGTGLPAPQKRSMTAVLSLARTSYGVLGNTVDLRYASSAVFTSASSGTVVRVTTGDGSCGLSMQVHADVVVSAGKLTTSSSCHIYGSVKAAEGVTTGSSSIIDGSVLTKPGMPVVRGSSSITGPVSTSASDPAWDPTPLPSITADLAPWTAKGFTTKPWPAGWCSVASSTTLSLAVTGPTIYDTRTACPSGITAGSSSRIRVVGGDVVLLVNGYTAATSALFTADTAGRRLWLIAPAAAGSTSCPSQGAMSFGSSGGAGSPTPGADPLGPRLFVYSPCSVSLGSSVTFTGQLWADDISIGSSVMLDLKDLGIPSASGSGSAGGVVRLSTS